MGPSSEHAASYRQEALDLLADIDVATLDLEKDETNPGLVNRLFRAFHTIKGSGAMFGFDEVARFAHHVESTLDCVRGGRVRVTNELIDLILAARDAIGILLVKSEAEQNAASEDRDRIVKDLGRLQGVTPAAHAAIQPEPQPSPQPAGRAMPEAPMTYRVHFAPGRDILKRGVDPLALLRELSRLGNAVTTAQVNDVPSLNDLVPEESYLAWDVTLTTRAPIPAVRDVFIFVEDECELEITECKDSHEVDPQPGGDKGPAGETGDVGGQLLREFQLEASEHLESCDRALVDLDRQRHDREAIGVLLRGIHSIKGTSSYLGLITISKLSHAFESLLETVRDEERKQATDEQLDLFSSVLDTLKALVAEPAQKPVPCICETLLARLVSENAGLESQAKNSEGAPPPVKSGATEIQVFLDSAKQYIDSMGSLLRDASRQGDLVEPNLGVLRRSCRSLRSSAAYMGHTELARRCEEVDGQLELIRSQAALRPIIERLQGSFEDIKASFTEVEESRHAIGRMAGKETGAASEVESAKPGVTPERRSTGDRRSGGERRSAGETATVKTMRIDQSMLDVFMDLVGELIVTRNTFHHIAKELEESQTSQANTLKELHEASSALDRISGGLQRKVMDMRMVPVRDLFKRFPRLVRDITRKNGKRVDLVLEGEDTEIDKGVAEDLVDPLVHIVRNSLDHGIEQPSVRTESKKAETGTLLLKAGQEGNNVFIEVLDDGGGINPERVLSKAIEKGLISAEKAKTLNSDEINNFIFLPGFSTAKEVTDISGRGVGMDVVQTNLRKLKGNVRLTSEIGKGTKVRLEVPLTLAILDVLLVGVGSATYAIPLHAVTEIVEGGVRRLQSLVGRKAIILRGEVVPVEMLSDLLTPPGRDSVRQELGNMAILVMQVGKHRRGIGVDVLYKRQEIVIKPLADYLFALPGIAGATILGDGRPVLILDPMTLSNGSGASLGKPA
jgi:two-component system, chemotaxis family, sensor kinase CheA